jgi:POT family proton-dependent oligopeptide transporter
MAVNIGAAFGVLIVGYLGERVGWHVGFTSAGLGLLLGLIVFLGRRRRDLGTIGQEPVAAPHTPRAPLLPAERRRLWAIGMLAPFSIVFWIAYAQIDGMLHLHVYNRTDRWVLGFEVPANWLLSLAAFYVVLLGPLFAWAWVRLEQAGRMPSTATKFSFGLGVTAASFLIVLLAVAEAGAAPDGKGSLQWLVVAYLLLVVGEMCIGPVAFAAVTRWSPPPLASLSIGAWFLSDAVANYGGGVVLIAALNRPISVLAGEREGGSSDRTSRTGELVKGKM